MQNNNCDIGEFLFDQHSEDEPDEPEEEEEEIILLPPLRESPLSNAAGKKYVDLTFSPAHFTNTLAARKPPKGPMKFQNEALSKLHTPAESPTLEEEEKTRN